MLLARRARFNSVPAALSATFIASASSAANQTTYDHSTFVIPRAGLVVVVATAESGSTRQFSSCTIGGGAATVATYYASNVAVQGGIAYKEMAAGTHNVSVTYSGGVTSAGVGVYLIENYTSATPNDTDNNYNGLSTAGTSTITIPANGVGIFGVAAAVSNDPTWSDATEDWSITPETNRFAGATLATETLLTDHVEIASFGLASGVKLTVAASWS